jgi:hypothetical protein
MMDIADLLENKDFPLPHRMDRGSVMRCRNRVDRKFDSPAVLRGEPHSILNHNRSHGQQWGSAPRASGSSWQPFLLLHGDSVVRFRHGWCLQPIRPIILSTASMACNAPTGKTMLPG